MPKILQEQAGRLVQYASNLSTPRIASTVRSASKTMLYLQQRRGFCHTGFLKAVQPYMLADIGEGITECQIISWAVKPGDRVEQFDLICEVQSDKASVEITSRYEGTIKKLHYDVDAMAKVGAPLLDIDVEGNEEETSSSIQEEATASDETMRDITERSDLSAAPGPPPSIEAAPPPSNEAIQSHSFEVAPDQSSSSNATDAKLAVPSVRRLLKQLGADITQIKGTGKDGRVLKEDVQKYASAMEADKTGESMPSTTPAPRYQATANDTTVALGAIQHAMFQSMTQSLTIPHFLYTQILNLTRLTALRRRLVSIPLLSEQLTAQGETKPKLSALPFVLKALSEAMKKIPIVNSSIEFQGNQQRPSLTMKAAHHIGVAMDTPKGLLVPVIKNVQDHSVISLNMELKRLSTVAKAGKLTPSDLFGATIVVSNIGSIGGHVVAPVIVSPTMMILGIGKSREVPAFEMTEDGTEHIVKREEIVLSWSADHRILDGATVARCAQIVGSCLENVEALGVSLV